MKLYGEIANIDREKLYVGKHCTDDGYVIDEFALFAYIKETYDRGVTICRFQKFGKIQYKTIFMSWEDFNYFYEPLTKGDD